MRNNKLLVSYLWDRGLFQAESRTPSEVAEHLCELAIKLGSSDNVTIVIVRFMHDE